MKDYLTLGPTPCEEDCQQVGTPEFDSVRAKMEMMRYREMLVVRFPNAPEFARFGIKQFPHDFGTYGEVVVYFDDSEYAKDSQEYAYFVESNLPSTWNDIQVLDWKQGKGE